MAKKNNKKRKNNNQNKNNASKKETNEKVVIKEEEKKIEEKIEIKEEEIKENTEEKKETSNEASKKFNRRFWIDVILLLLIFCVIGILLYQLMSNSVVNNTKVNTLNVIDYEIKNSTLDMSVEEYKESLEEYKLNTSIFANIEMKEINEKGKNEGLLYYQALLGDNNAVGIVTKKDNGNIVSIEFMSKKDNFDYKEDFKKIIEYTLISSGMEEDEASNVINKYDNRASFDKTIGNMRVYMDYSSKDYFVAKIIYNKRLGTRLKSIYSQELSSLIGDVN